MASLIRLHVPDSLPESMLVEWNRLLADVGSDPLAMTDAQRARYFGARSMLAVLAGSLGITGADWLLQLGQAAAELVDRSDPAVREHFRAIAVQRPTWP